MGEQPGFFGKTADFFLCLATRIPTGNTITPESLARTEAAEDCLHNLGLRDFRVRTLGDTARIQVTESDLETVLNNREAIVSHLKTLYSGVTLDLEVRP